MKNPYKLNTKKFKSLLIKEALTLFRKLSFYKYIQKNYKVASGTDWKTEVFLEFPLEKDALGIMKDLVFDSRLKLHYILQDVWEDEYVDEAEVDFDLTLLIKLKNGQEIEEVLTDGQIELTL